MRDMKNFWWTLPASDLPSVLVRRFGALNLAARAIGVSSMTIINWREHRILPKYHARLMVLGISRRHIEAHNKRFPTSNLTKQTYQAAYYLAHRGRRGADK